VTVSLLKLWVPHRPSSIIVIEAADRRVVMRLSTSMVYLLKRVSGGKKSTKRRKIENKKVLRKYKKFGPEDLTLRVAYIVCSLQQQQWCYGEGTN
jgi:hypothetical protein